jgi:hypothetical protein
MKNLFIFLLIAVSLLMIEALLKSPPHRYVGRIISVDSWNGAAKLLTKTDNNKDSVIIVIPNRYEHFVVNQVITAWTGGEMINNATTTPQD